VKALVVDDEAPARAKLVRLLRDDGRFELAGEARDGVRAVEAIETLHPDLVLLDVQMPGLTGFEVLRAIGVDACPKVIFTTAHDRFALDAFEAHAVDYLLKPFDAARFAIALDRATAILRGERGGDAVQLGAVLERCTPRYLERLVVRRDDGWVAVPLARVRRFEAADKHVRVYADGSPALVRESLGDLEQRLDAARFARVHRGDIVNLASVVRMDPLGHGDAVLELDDGTSVVLSRTYRESFVARWRS